MKIQLLPFKKPTIAIVILSFAVPISVKADLQSEMDSMFGTMTNVSSPTAHMGQRRGVISGGSVVARNRIVETNLASWVPPSFSAGCGGIDLYGGSFSFINMNQFITMMRAIPANAAGYAFQLAINAMSPAVGEIMTDLQKKIQAFNQHFSNSCQLAQGLVNDATSILPQEMQQKMKKSNISIKDNITDVFGANTNTTGLGDPSAQIKTAAPNEVKTDIQGNLVWRALNKNNAGSWFKFGGNDLLQAIMSLTGSVIVQPLQAAPDGKGDSNPVATIPKIINLKDLINGSGNNGYQKVRAYKCDTLEIDGCLSPTPESINLIGLKQRVSNILLGTPSNMGLIYKFATNSGTLSNAEMGFMEVVPSALGAIIRNLAREDIGSARTFAAEASPMISLELAQLMVYGMIEAVEQASRLKDQSYSGLLQTTISAARQEIQAESEELSGRYGSPQQMLAFYTNLMNASKAKSYGSFAQSPASQDSYPSN